MKKVYTFLAEGFEEIEALAIVDILRRADIEVDTVSIAEDLYVVGAHGIAVMADTLIGLCDFDDADLLFLPGGMPGAANLLNSETLCNLLTKKARECTALAAICAAPSVLGVLELLTGRQATCYPGFEENLKEAHVDSGACVVSDLTDGKSPIFTACGPAAADILAFTLVAYLTDKETADKVRTGMMYERRK